ncbi:MAG: glycosyltransferase family 2 protein [Sulfolobales archaeon]
MERVREIFSDTMSIEMHEINPRDSREKILVSIVIPTYNEAENIEELLTRIKRSLERDLGEEKYEIILVDDNSPDGTSEKAINLMKKMNLRGRVIIRKNLRGLGGAIVTGIRFSSGEYVTVIDADLQHPPEEIIKMLNRAIEGRYDLVIASRNVSGGGVEGWSFHRRLISRMAAYTARILIPHVRKIKDPMSGFFLFKREKVDPEKLKGDGMKVLLEIIVRGDIERIHEYPYIFRRRVRGRSKLGFKEIIDFIRQILRLSEYRLLKFMTVGASGVLVNNAVLFLLVENGMSRFIASPIAIEISTLSNFTLNDLWTFSRDREGGLIKRLMGYHLAVAVGNTVIYVTFAILSYYVYYIIANIIGIILGFITNYFISSEFVWGLRRYARYIKYI